MGDLQSPKAKPSPLCASKKIVQPRVDLFYRNSWLHYFLLAIHPHPVLAFLEYKDICFGLVFLYLFVKALLLFGQCSGIS